MKTSVIEVHAMLSVLSVDEVERRIGEVPGVESVTVNFAAGSATVRYDETRLEIADIRSAVRQRGYESAAPAAGSAGDGHEGHTAPGATPATPAPAAPKTPAVAPATVGAAATGAAQQDKAASKPSSVAPAAVPTSVAPAGDGQQHKAAPDKS
jgi:P-type Cu2+ transporter